MKRTIIFCLILLIGLGGQNCSKSRSTAKSSPVAIPVNVTEVRYGDVEQKLNFLGNVSALQEVKVYSTIPTRIVDMRVDIGQKVKKGQVLALVDDEKIKQAVAQAEAALEAARAQYRNVEVEYNRIQRLFKENAVSQAQFDGVKTQYEASASTVKQLEAALNNARAQLKDCTISAPIDGVIASRLLNEGDQAAPQIPIFTIVQSDQVKIDIEVVEAQIELVKPGQKAYIEVNAYPERRFVGRINKIYPTVNPVSRTVTAEVLVDNPEGLLKPGMYAKVVVVVASHKGVLVIPRYALLERTTLEYLGGEITNTEVKVNRYVYVVSDSIALERPVQIGIEDGKLVEILSGLKPNQLVVTLGQHNLYDSAIVAIVKKEG